MLKLTIIGFWGGYPRLNEASAGYLLEEDGFQIMIDFGSGVLSKMQNIVQPEQLDAVILSHYHPDHVADIGVLQHARLIQNFLGNKSACLPIYGHPFDKEEFSKLTYRKITKGVAIEPQKTLTIGPFRVQFLKTNHPVPCFAMRFEAKGKSLVYTADTAFKEEFIPFSAQADLLVCECNFYKDQEGKNAGHMNSHDAGKLARAANVKELLLTHLPHYGEHSNLVKEAAEKYSGSISLAAYEKVITI